MLRVSFIIPCLNSAETLAATLDGILASDLVPLEREIIVVDNGSQDDTVQIAKRYPVIVTSCERQCAGAARNQGAKIATGEFLAFVDSDVVLETDWARELLSLFESGFYSAVLGRVIPAGSKTFLNEYRRALNHRRYVGTNISLFHPEGIGAVINTAACMYRRSTFLALGGFDERLKRLEDTELSCRLFSIGGAFCATSKARAHVTYAESVFSYVHRSFKLGQSKYPIVGLSRTSTSEALKELTDELINQKVSMFTPEQKLFFWLNTLMSYLGFLCSLTQKKISPNAPPLHLGGKLISLFMLSSENRDYRLSSEGRILRVDEKLYFFSTKTGEWQDFKVDQIPWEKLVGTGVLQQVTFVK